MSRLDDRIRDGLRQAGPAAAPDLGALTDEITRRRRHRDTVRRVQAGAVALGVIAVVAISFSLAIARSQQDDVPIGPQPAPTAPPAGAVAIPGIPFPVCRPMPIPGDFGEGLDTLWMVTRSGPDGNCSTTTGSPYLGIGSPSEVVVLSGPLDDIGQEPGAILWPFATPDIDGDGIDEIAVGLDGSRTDGYARIALYRVTDDSLAYVAFDCGPACDPVPWIGLGTFVESLSGAYCGPAGFVRWSASEGRVIGTVWALEGDRLVAGETVFDRTDDGSDYPPDGMNELCGSPTTFPEDFDVPDLDTSASAGPPTAVQGEDIGIGTNVCGAERLGGLDLFTGSPRETAWTGYLVKDDGTCPDRNPEAQIWFVAIDAASDGIADTWTTFEPDNCPYVGCRPLAATDLDGDGDTELIVTSGFSIQDQTYFEIETGDGGASIAPILVAPPGHPEAGIAGGQALVTSTGGDEGDAAWIRCEGYPASPVLVFTSVSSVVDSDEPAQWHEVKLQLLSDGMFHVVDSTDLSVPPGEDPGLIRSESPACDVDFTP